MKHLGINLTKSSQWVHLWGPLKVGYSQSQAVPQGVDLVHVTLLISQGQPISTCVIIYI